ncbi:MAG: methyltransferase domain-containing protein [Melioribacteraceae bacterium]|nr:methyltransferase domain-containing protein [Melioribacteraceae bacterium]
MKCRFCNNELKHVFLDLGYSPPSNAFLNLKQLNEPEIHYPLRVFVCEKCYLVQSSTTHNSSEIFNKDYVYYSSYSKNWLSQSKKYTEYMINRFHLSSESFVLEVASNDGYLLQYFANSGIPVLGIEPSSGPAEIALSKGIPTEITFFGSACAKKLKAKGVQSDLIVANNVIAHIPDINDFVSGFKYVLKEEGIITLEFQHLVNIISEIQFDTIYHEHYYYHSLITLNKIFLKNDLEIFDIQCLTSHGGSLRVFAKNKSNKTYAATERFKKLLKKEEQIGINRLEYYQGFQLRVNDIKNKLLAFLITTKNNNHSVIGYGAAAKGNTLINYCGIKKDLLNYVVDASPHKVGLFLPASHIPVYDRSMITKTKPDYVLILPWNLKDEIMTEHSYIEEWGGKFVIAIPDLTVLN